MVGRPAAVKKYILRRSLGRTERKLERLRAQVSLYEEIEAVDIKLRILTNCEALYAPARVRILQPRDCLVMA